MHDVCPHEYQDMAGIFVMEVKTYRKNIRRKKDVTRLLTMVIGEGGVTRDLSVSHSLAVKKQCLSSQSWFWFGLRGCLGNQLHTSTLYPLHVYPNSFSQWNKSHNQYIGHRPSKCLTAKGSLLHTYEPVNGKTNEMMCAKQRLRSAWASAQFDHRLHCRMKKAWVLHRYPLSAQRRLIRLSGPHGGCA